MKLTSDTSDEAAAREHQASLHGCPVIHGEAGRLRVPDIPQRHLVVIAATEDQVRLLRTETASSEITALLETKRFTSEGMLPDVVRVVRDVGHRNFCRQVPCFHRGIV